MNKIDYNTQRTHIKLREYGRNVQNLVASLLEEESKEKRSEKADLIVKLIKQINPNYSKYHDDHDQKIWDDLHIISDFKLEIESPYPKPEPSILTKQPERLQYFSNEIKFRHFGRTIEQLIEKAKMIEDKEEKEGAVILIGRLMKSFYQTWSRDSADDAHILSCIQKMSGQSLDFDIEKIKEFNLFNMPKQQNNKRRYKNNTTKNVRNSNGKLHNKKKRNHNQ